MNMSRQEYKAGLKVMNQLRQLKIDGLHELKQNSVFAKYVHPAIYSNAVNWIKKAIREDDLIIARFKEDYRNRNNPPVQEDAEELLVELLDTLKATEHYVRHYAAKNHDGHAAGVLNAIKDKLVKTKKFLAEDKK